MSMQKLEKQIRKLIEETFGEQWPIVAYVLYVRTTDPETMTADEPLLISPEGQRSFTTRGLLEEATTDFAALNAAVFVDADWGDDDDE